MNDDNIKKETDTQTRLHVQPHLFHDENQRALVTCERACQTAVTSFPDIENSVFYSLLEFIPYKEIYSNALRILDLPRKQRLQFKLPESLTEFDRQDTSLSMNNVDDVAKLPPTKKALKQIRFSLDNNPSNFDIIKISKIAESTQTSLTVVPYVLEENEVAKIFDTTSSQVDSNFFETILSELVSRINVLNNLNETKCKHYVVCTKSETSNCTCYCKDAQNPCILCACNLSELNKVKLILSSASSYYDKHTQTSSQDFLVTTSVQAFYSKSSEQLKEYGDKPIEGSGYTDLKNVSSVERDIVSSVSQIGKTLSCVLSSDVGCKCETLKMSSKTPLATNRKNETDDKKVICTIKIKTNNDMNADDARGWNEKKTVSLNTGDKNDVQPVNEFKPKRCECNKSEEPSPKAEPFVLLSEIDNTYFEHYIEELQNSSTGVQTELQQNDSADSLPALPEDEVCEKGTEMPWQKIVLSPPEKYTIRSSKVEKPEEEKPFLPTPDETPHKVVFENVNVNEDTDPLDHKAVIEENANVNEDTDPLDLAEEETIKQEIIVDREIKVENEEEETASTEAPAQESSEPPAVKSTEPPVEKKKQSDDKDCREPLKLLAYSGDALLYNEPYMDIMLKLFPDPYEHCPPNETEMPWNDILLPKHVKLRQQTIKKQQQQQQVKNMKNNYSSFFISAKEENTDVDIILMANTTEKASCPISVKGGAASQVTISMCSSASSSFMKKPKRNTKDTSLCCHVCSSHTRKKPDTTKEIPLVTKKSSSMPNISSTDNSTGKIPKTQSSCGCKSIVTPSKPPSVTKSSVKGCSCKTSLSKSSFTKQDAVAAALEVYETEMRPLKAALDELKNKIRSLNITDLDKHSMDSYYPTPSCEKLISSSPPLCPFLQLTDYSTDKNYRKKQVPVERSKHCNGNCTKGKGTKKSSSRKKGCENDERNAYKGCSSTNLTETTSKCPFIELVHSISNKTLSDHDCKSQCGDKNRAFNKNKYACVTKISSNFDGSLFNSRRGIRTEPAKSSATIKTKVFARSGK